MFRYAVRKPLISALMLFTAILVPVPQAVAASCANPSDWQNINVLPTNGDAGTNIRIKLEVDKTEVVPGDRISLTFQADQECHLTIMNLGTSGRIVRLWPNSYSQGENRIPAHSPRKFPGPDDNFAYKIGGPTGVERIIAYATSEKGKILSEEEFGALQGTAFKQFKGSSKDLAVVFQNQSQALPQTVKWGSAQVNLCIGGAGQPTPTSVATPPPQRPDEGQAEKNLYCVAVGVSTGKLKYCEDDARRFVSVMKSKLGIQDSNVQMLLGPEATYDGFVKALNWVGSRARPEDSAIIYFNGHGTQLPDQPPLDEVDGRDEAFVLYHRDDRKYSWREALRKKFLMLDDEFNILMKKIPARNKILIADCCHSGTISKELQPDPKELVPKYYPLVEPDTGKELPSLKSKAVPVNYGNDNEACMASCLDNESSYESPGLKSSVFTHHLLKAIEKGSLDLQTAFLNAREETINYCQEAAVKGKQQLSQTPSLTDPHGLVKIVIFPK
jgi:hypothetical protein